MKQLWRAHREYVLMTATAVLLIASTICYALGYEFVLMLTPIVLALVTAAVLLEWDAPAKTKIVILAATVVVGFVIAQISLHTGLVFGDYTYGSVLGFRAWGVPILIGLLWFIVTVAAWHLVSFGKLTTVQKFLLGGVLVVMFDLVLEQFATVFNVWIWQTGSIPLSNYVSWFVISMLYFGLYNWRLPRRQPSVYIAGLLPILGLYCWAMLLTVR